MKESNLSRRSIELFSRHVTNGQVSLGLNPVKRSDEHLF